MQLDTSRHFKDKDTSFDTSEAHSLDNYCSICLFMYMKMSVDLHQGGNPV